MHSNCSLKGALKKNSPNFKKYLLFKTHCVYLRLETENIFTLETKIVYSKRVYFKLSIKSYYIYLIFLASLSRLSSLIEISQLKKYIDSSNSNKREATCGK